MPFQKGHKLAVGGARPGSGPKSGAIKKTIQELAGQYRVEAIERLAFWMRSDNPKASPAASMAYQRLLPLASAWRRLLWQTSPRLQARIGGHCRQVRRPA